MIDDGTGWAWTLETIVNMAPRRRLSRSANAQHPRRTSPRICADAAAEWERLQVAVGGEDAGRPNDHPDSPARNVIDEAPHSGPALPVDAGGPSTEAALVDGDGDAVIEEMVVDPHVYVRGERLSPLRSRRSSVASWQSRQTPFLRTPARRLSDVTPAPPANGTYSSRSCQDDQDRRMKETQETLFKDMEQRMTAKLVELLASHTKLTR